MSQILETYDKKKAAIWLAATIVAIVLIDQALKFWVKLSFPLGSGVDVCGWFQIYFVENKGKSSLLRSAYWLASPLSTTCTL